MFDEIIEKTKSRVEKAKELKSLEELKQDVSKLEISHEFPFKKALSQDDLSLIIEVEHDDFDEHASAISFLTIDNASKDTSLPWFAKEIIIDEYMIYEAKVAGASAVLINASVLDIVSLKKFLDLSRDLGMSAIVEVVDSTEVSTAMIVGAEIICVKNSDDIENTISLRRCLSDECVFICEGNIKTNDDFFKLKENNIDAILISENSIKSILGFL